VHLRVAYTAPVILTIVLLLGLGPTLKAVAQTSDHLGWYAEHSLSGRESFVIRDASGALFRLNIAFFEDGARVLLFVGQSGMDGGRNSVSLSSISRLRDAIAAYPQSMTLAEARTLPDASARVSLDSAVSVVDEAWAERTWCYQGRGVPHDWNHFNHTRSFETRQAMIDAARYLPQHDIWVFEGFCIGAFQLG
jgi:hypothetical protein